MSFQKPDRIYQSKFNRKMNRAATITNGVLTEALSKALQDALGCFPSAAKIIAHRVQRNPRAARNWLDAKNAPRAAEFIELAREFDEVHEVYMHLTNRASKGSSDPEIKRKADLILKILTGDGDENLRH